MEKLLYQEQLVQIRVNYFEEGLNNLLFYLSYWFNIYIENRKLFRIPSFNPAYFPKYLFDLNRAS